MFEFEFVGDGILDVPKRCRYINSSKKNKHFITTRTITNSERSDH